MSAPVAEARSRDHSRQSSRAGRSHEDGAQEGLAQVCLKREVGPIAASGGREGPTNPHIVIPREGHRRGGGGSWPRPLSPPPPPSATWRLQKSWRSCRLWPRLKTIPKAPSNVSLWSRAPWRGPRRTTPVHPEFVPRGLRKPAPYNPWGRTLHPRPKGVTYTHPKGVIHARRASSHLTPSTLWV